MTDNEKADPTGWHVSSFRYHRFCGNQRHSGDMYSLEHSDRRHTQLALFVEDSGQYTTVERGSTWSKMSYSGCWDYRGKDYDEWFERVNRLALEMNEWEAIAEKAGETAQTPAGVTIFQPCWDWYTREYFQEDEEDDKWVTVSWEVFLVSPSGDEELFRSGEEEGESEGYGVEWIDNIVTAAEEAAMQEISRRNAHNPSEKDI